MTLDGVLVDDRVMLAGITDQDEVEARIGGQYGVDRIALVRFVRGHDELGLRDAQIAKEERAIRYIVGREDLIEIGVQVPR